MVQCQTNPISKAEYDNMKEMLKLKKEIEELKKENLFLKKSGDILCKGNRLEIYHFINRHKETFGLRRLLNRLEIYPNAYYNYLKQRKSTYYSTKQAVLSQIEQIYHNHNGVAGYRQMTKYLADEGLKYSLTNIHKYMNKEMKLQSIVRPEKIKYRPEKAYHIFDNKLNRNFVADEANQKWCTDFTYLYLANHDVRYNCTILDLYRRNVVACITERNMTSDLAIHTLQKALDSHPNIKGDLILHADRGSQFISRALS